VHLSADLAQLDVGGPQLLKELPQLPGPREGDGGQRRSGVRAVASLGRRLLPLHLLRGGVGARRGGTERRGEGRVKRQQVERGRKRRRKSGGCLLSLWHVPAAKPLAGRHSVQCQGVPI